MNSSLAECTKCSSWTSKRARRAFVDAFSEEGYCPGFVRRLEIHDVANGPNPIATVNEEYKIKVVKSKDAKRFCRNDHPYLDFHILVVTEADDSVTIRRNTFLLLIEAIVLSNV